jgi:hypothetical protein
VGAGALVVGEEENAFGEGLFLYGFELLMTGPQRLKQRRLVRITVRAAKVRPKRGDLLLQHLHSLRVRHVQLHHHVDRVEVQRVVSLLRPVQDEADFVVIGGNDLILHEREGSMQDIGHAALVFFVLLVELVLIEHSRVAVDQKDN